MMTLPKIAQEHRLSLDGLRYFVRKSPELARLGVMVGPSRVYTAEEAEQIRAAFVAKRPALTKT
jgi:hypothetical protein